MSSRRPVIVGHYVRTFLPTTENWIYEQIRHAESVQHVIFTRKRVNPGEYPWPVIHEAYSIKQQVGRALFGFYPAHASAGRAIGLDLIHAHFGDRGILALNLAHHLDVPLITSFYGRDLTRKIPGYERLFRHGSLFLVEGPAARDRLIELGCPAERIRIQRLGIDVGAYRFRARRRPEGQPLRLLMAGRFTEKKGFVYAIRAFVRAAREVPMMLTVVGDAGCSSREKAVKAQLVKEVEEGGVEDRVQFAGFMSHSHLLAAAVDCDLVVQPSVVARDGDREGGHPVVLTELAAMGIPAIATRHCDIPEIVADGQTGWLCDERDVAGLHRAMVEAWHRPEVIERMGFAARALVERKYDVRTQTLDATYAEYARSRSESTPAVTLPFPAYPR